MSKKASAIVLVIVAVIVLAIAFFAVYPVTISYGHPISFEWRKYLIR